MDYSSIHGLINNSALLITLVLLYDILTLSYVGGKTFINQIFTGIVLGVIGIAPWKLLKFLPQESQPDLRSLQLCQRLRWLLKQAQNHHQLF